MDRMPFYVVVFQSIPEEDVPNFVEIKVAVP